MMSNNDLSKYIKVNNDVKMLLNSVAGKEFSNVYCLINALKSSKYFNDDVIDYCIAYYYLLNKDINSNQMLISLIETNVDDKNLLRNFFNNDLNVFSSVMLNIFVNYNNVDISNYNFSSKAINVANKISKPISFVGLDYISTVSRFTLFDAYLSRNFNGLSVEDFSLMIKFLLSDAYTSMSIFNSYDERINFLKGVIESNCDSLKNLVCKMNKIVNGFSTCFYLQVMLYNNVEYYDDAYELASKNNKVFKKVINKINPLYKIDYIESFDSKQFRK